VQQGRGEKRQPFFKEGAYANAATHKIAPPPLFRAQTLEHPPPFRSQLLKAFLSHVLLFLILIIKS